MAGGRKQHRRNHQSMKATSMKMAENIETREIEKFYRRKIISAMGNATLHYTP